MCRLIISVMSDNTKKRPVQGVFFVMPDYRTQELLITAIEFARVPVELATTAPVLSAQAYPPDTSLADAAHADPPEATEHDVFAAPPAFFWRSETIFLNDPIAVVDAMTVDVVVQSPSTVLVPKFLA